MFLWRRRDVLAQLHLLPRYCIWEREKVQSEEEDFSHFIRLPFHCIDLQSCVAVQGEAGGGKENKVQLHNVVFILWAFFWIDFCETLWPLAMALGALVLK